MADYRDRPDRDHLRFFRALQPLLPRHRYRHWHQYHPCGQPEPHHGPYRPVQSGACGVHGGRELYRRLVHHRLRKACPRICCPFPAARRSDPWRFDGGDLWSGRRCADFAFKGRLSGDCDFGFRRDHPGDFPKHGGSRSRERTHGHSELHQLFLGMGGRSHHHLCRHLLGELNLRTRIHRRA